MGKLNVQDPQPILGHFWNISDIKGALTLDSTEDMMMIGWAYDMTLPLVSNGTSHTEDETIMICSQLADTVRWRISILFRLLLSHEHITADVCHRRQKYRGLYSAVITWEEADTELVGYLGKHSGLYDSKAPSYTRKNKIDLTWKNSGKRWNESGKIIYCCMYCNGFTNIMYTFTVLKFLFIKYITIYDMFILKQSISSEYITSSVRCPYHVVCMIARPSHSSHFMSSVLCESGLDSLCSAHGITTKGFFQHFLGLRRWFRKVKTKLFADFLFVTSHYFTGLQQSQNTLTANTSKCQLHKITVLLQRHSPR
jgi:hypothetical protein